MHELDQQLAHKLGRRSPTAQTEWEAQPAAVLVPLFRRNNAWHVLLTQRTHDVPSHKGQVAFPGGKVEAEDHDRIETALREAEEEIGLLRSDVRILGTLDELITSSRWRITPVVGVFEHPYSFTPSLRELSVIFDVPLTWLANPAHLTVATRDPLLPGPPIEVFHFQYEQFDIWGATARILRNLLAVIEE
ncbi:MAG: CoA pyrophosphatase [Chloroflexi bacterium]|nr:CoA pyrophosphatase [Chloroflexota bacterium]